MALRAMRLKPTEYETLNTVGPFGCDMGRKTQTDEEQSEKARVAQDETHFGDSEQSDYAEYMDMEKEIRGE